MDGRGEAVRGEHRDLERLPGATSCGCLARPGGARRSPGRPRGAEQLDEDLRKGTRLSVNVDRLPSPDNFSGWCLMQTAEQPNQ
jgi:hypothetical protein